MGSQFYSDINTDDMGKYQKYFLEMLKNSNIENLTKWSQGLEYSKEEYDKSYENMQPILDKAEKEGLIPLNLQIMFEQYVFADIIQREKFKNHWVERILNRKEEDFFPDPNSVLKSLEK